MRVRFRIAAREDLRNAIRWYRERDVEAAARFRAEFANAIEHAREYPHAWPKAHNNIRKIVLKRFPYNMYYMIEANSLLVLAVVHQMQHPQAWRQRIEEE